MKDSNDKLNDCFTVSRQLAGNPEKKVIFHRRARAFFKAMCQEFNMAGDIRSNMGGDACTGETTLHGDNLYIQICSAFNGGGMQFLIRSCKGRKDYTGGRNHFSNLNLNSFTVLLLTIREAQRNDA